MEILKNNPSLMLDAVDDKIKTAYATFIVSAYLQDVAEELSKHFINNVFEFIKNGKKLTVEEAVEMGLLRFNIVIEKKFNNTEWILITESHRFYSKGDNSN